LPVGTFAYLDKDLACFRLHGASKTGRKGSFVEERGLVLQEFFDRNFDCGIAQYRDLVYAWHHFHAGEELYSKGNLSDALHEFSRSCKYKPFSLRTWYVLLAALDKRLETRFLAMMQRLYRLSPKSYDQRD